MSRLRNNQERHGHVYIFLISISSTFELENATPIANKICFLLFKIDAVYVCNNVVEKIAKKLKIVEKKFHFNKNKQFIMTRILVMIVAA